MNLIEYLYKTVRIKTTWGETFTDTVTGYENAIENDLEYDRIEFDRPDCILSMGENEIESIEVISR